jgi:hypothetical protein
MNRRSLISAISASLIAVAAAGCAGSGSTPSPAQRTAAPTAAATAASAAPEMNLTIYHEDNAQVELIAGSGKRVLIDVWDPTQLSAPATANDILLTTHSHTDHYYGAFVDSFPGKKLTIEAGTLEADGVSIVGIPAAHDEGAPIAAKDGSDYIFVIDIAGLRIGHFGDLGQNKLTDEQLAKIGKLDIAFSQLSNSFSSMDETNKKGFNQMGQVKPLILVPTHFDAATIKLAGTTWPGSFSTKSVTISRSKLPAATSVLVLGTRADMYGQIAGYSQSAW